MYREIIKPTNEEYTIKIPKKYLNSEVEILILPFSLYNEQAKKKKSIDRLLDVGVWRMEEEDVKVRDWKIEEF